MSKEKGGSKKLGRGRKRQWMGQISKEGKENRRYENGEERWIKKYRVGKKSTKVGRE